MAATSLSSTRTRTKTVSDSKYAAQTAWNTANTKLIQLKLNLRTDSDILRRLAEVDSKQGYIKALIRADIEKAED